jgi:hypothetical protein
MSRPIQVGSAKGILFLTDLIFEVKGWTLMLCTAFLRTSMLWDILCRPDQTWPPLLTYQDFDSAPRRLEIPTNARF